MGSEPAALAADIDEAAVKAAARARRRPFYALLVASGGFVIVLDSFGANVAFPKLSAEFSGTARSTLAWVSSGYSIALAAPLLVAGALGDRYGRRRLYLGGMVAFVIGGIASALATGPAMLITTRVLQGCAGSAMISTSIALALAEYPPERRGFATGWMGVMGSLASLAGPVLAGNIIDIGGSWRWVFLIPVPIGIAVLATGRRVLGEGRDATAAVATPGQKAAPIDYLGVAFVVAAAGLLTFGIQRTSQWGWLDRRTGVTIAVACLFGALFVWRCRTASPPIMDLRLFTERAYLAASVLQLPQQFAIFAYFFWTPLFLTNVWGYRASTVGWVVSIPLGLSLMSVPVGRFTDRHGHRGVLVVGALVAAAAHGWWYFALDEDPSFWTGLLPGALGFGAGIGMVGITALAAALSRVEPNKLATANSAFQTGRRVVQTLGIATVVAILGDRTTDSVERFRIVWLVGGVAFVVSAVVALWFPARARPGVN